MISKWNLPGNCKVLYVQTVGLKWWMWIMQELGYRKPRDEKYINDLLTGLLGPY